jgi:hypothetical protein
MRRISIAGVLGVVAVFAVGLAALVQATDVWSGVVFTLTIGLLMASVLAVCLRGWRSGAWLGFTVFGWGYLLVGNISGLNLATQAWLLSDSVAEWVFSTSNAAPVPPAVSHAQTPYGYDETPEHTAFRIAAADYNSRLSQALMIGRLLWVLMFAGVGATVVSVLARPRRTGGIEPADPKSPVG